MKPYRIPSLARSLVLGLFLAHAALAAPSESPPESGWDYGAQIYLWGASIGGQTAAGSDIDVDFGDLIDNLKMTFMGTLGAHKDEWSLVADVIYLDVGGEEVVEGVRAGIDLRSWVITPDIAYTVLSGDQGRLDLHAGARYLYLDAEVHVGPERLSKSNDIWDGILGIQGRATLSEKLYLRYYLDVGTGGSEVTWQALAGLGYQFKHCDGILGYRYLTWDIDDSPVIGDLTLSGAFAGVRFYF